MTSQLEWFYEHVYNNNDPRTSDWFLVSRPWSLILIISSYIYFCVSAGPKYMRNREPYSLRTTLIIYNFVQVLLSIYLFYEVLMIGWLSEYSYTCEPVDYSESPSAMRAASVTHFYFVCKISELLDTVFFVFRKKERQISFLHLYHHALMPVFTWIASRYIAGGHTTFLGLINSFIHIIMYTYYMLAALGPEIQKHLWWKKHLTLLQIAQFFMIGLHSAQMLFTDCPFPKLWSSIVVGQSIVFVYMFGSFYYKNHFQSKASNNVKVGSTDSRTGLKSD